MINEPRSGPELKIRDLYKPPEKTSLSHFFKCLTEGTAKKTISNRFLGENWSDCQISGQTNSKLVRFL
jgi:hypothetical protein